MQSDIRCFKDLDAWKVNIELVLISYELAKRLPLTERFELSAQIRRAAVSVPSNVAEGQAVGKSLRFCTTCGSRSGLSASWKPTSKLRDA